MTTGKDGSSARETRLSRGTISDRRRRFSERRLYRIEPDVDEKSPPRKSPPIRHRRSMDAANPAGRDTLLSPGTAGAAAAAAATPATRPLWKTVERLGRRPLPRRRSLQQLQSTRHLPLRVRRPRRAHPRGFRARRVPSRPAARIRRRGRERLWTCASSPSPASRRFSSPRIPPRFRASRPSRSRSAPFVSPMGPDVTPSASTSPRTRRRPSRVRVGVSAARRRPRLRPPPRSTPSPPRRIAHRRVSPRRLRPCRGPRARRSREKPRASPGPTSRRRCRRRCPRRCAHSTTGGGGRRRVEARPDPDPDPTPDRTQSASSSPPVCGLSTPGVPRSDAAGTLSRPSSATRAARRLRFGRERAASSSRMVAGLVPRKISSAISSENVGGSSRAM